MIARGLVALTLLSTCVLSLPGTHSQLENEDVKVMKCIVEALTDVLSRPHPLPVSEECLVTLRTDDRLVSVLRHHNFLKALQDIAVQGHQEREAEAVTHTQAADDVADRSMLEALGGSGERPIPSQKRRPGNRAREEEKKDSMEADGDAVEEKRGSEEGPGSHASTSEEDKEVSSEEENTIKDKKAGGRSGEKKHAANKSREKKSVEEDEKKDKRSRYSSLSAKPEEEEEEEGEMKRGSRESREQWAKRGKSVVMKKKKVGKEAEQEAPHHSKEVPDEEEDEKKKRNMQRTPEEKELQMIARRGPKERKESEEEEEEEGSGSRKPEEPEIESLAAIESELENVAQKLHGMRRG